MDFVKQYIVQSISAASNNLRLNTQKIEVVALFREFIVKSENIEEDIKQMKKITELSTLAIRLNEIFRYLKGSQIDLLKMSDKFKEHSQYLIKDLNAMLETVTPAVFKMALDKMKSQNVQDKIGHQRETSPELKIDLTKRGEASKSFEKSETDILKEKFILEEDRDEEDVFFQNYEAEVLKPIKPIDGMLKRLAENEVNTDQLNSYAKIMRTNGALSAKIGFDIIANMHKIIALAFQLIKTRELMPGREVIESMRACLIVIVAVVKGKEVDITNYLNRAEEFGREIHTIKIKG